MYNHKITSIVENSNSQRKGNYLNYGKCREYGRNVEFRIMTN